mmetsp:Transcript_21519/g.44881  ORF Transcript_21519/g.44881 Transcript_21519/m.44881 type:complete len:281 (-) Transcript_21519:1044-1886(-)
MTSSVSVKDQNLTVLLGAVAAVTAATAATITYLWTKKREDDRHNAHIYREYEREKMIKAKTAQARLQHAEPPSGTLLKDVTIDKIFLWELEDLSKKYPSALIENVMHNKSLGARGIRSPVLRQKSSVGDGDSQKGHLSHDTPYNKLISNHECIIGDVIRKPNMHTHTVAYVRAGPRRLLHFDPKHVNAAIVTCGGLCPGLNNVIREITKTLHQLYAIGGEVYGIQGGYRGFWDPAPYLQPLLLTPEMVDNIHHEGGTVLGSSRGGFDLDKILDFLQKKEN